MRQIRFSPLAVATKATIILALGACVTIPKINPPTSGADTVSPSVEIAAPTSGATFVVGNSVTISGVASDDTRVTLVEVQMGAGATFVSASGTTGWSLVADSTGLAPGSYAITVRASDAAGNQGTAQTNITLITPVAVLTDAPASLTSSNAIAVAVSGTQITQYRYRLDGGAFSANTPIATPITATGLADGPHKLDVVGGTENGIFQTDVQATSVTWTIDSTAPIATLTPTPASPTNQTTYTIMVGGGGVIGYQYQLDGGALSTVMPVSSAIFFTVTAQTSHTLDVFGIDLAGNEQHAATTVTWTIDTTPPVIVLINAPAAIDNDASPTITLTQGNGISTFSWSVVCNGVAGGSANGVPATTAIHPVGLVDGPCVLSVTALDAAGNSASLTFDWTLDTTTPDTTLTGVPSDPTTATSLDVTVSGTNSADRYTYSLDCADPFVDVVNQAVSSLTTHITASAIPDGTCTLTVAVGNGLNVDISPKVVSWEVDTTAPGGVAINRTTPATSPTQSMTLAATVTTTDTTTTGYTYDYTLDCAGTGSDTSGTGVAITTSISASGLPDGTCTLSVTLKDVVGNAASAVTSSWIIDTTAPGGVAISRTTPATSPTQATTLAATVTTTDASSTGYTYDYTLDCTGDTATDAPIATPITATGIPDGPCTLSVTLKDALGNAAAAVTSTWTVDTTAPGGIAINRTTPATSPTTVTTLAATVSTTDASSTGDTYDYALDCAGVGSDTSATDVAIATPITAAGLPDGACTLSVTVKDALGNAASAVASSWIIDTSGPGGAAITRTTPATSPTTATTLSATVTTTDVSSTGYTYNYSLDCAGSASDTSGSAVPIATAITASSLPDGACTLSVTLKDALGNAAGAVTSSWTIDTSGPGGVAITRTTPATSPTTTTTLSASVTTTDASSTGYTYNYSLDCAGAGSDTSASAVAIGTAITAASLPDGVCTLSVTLKDALGNAATAVTSSWTIDTTAPGGVAITRTTPATSPTTATTLNAAVTTTDTSSTGYTYDYSLDCAGSASDASATGVAIATPLTAAGLPDGACTLSVTLKDALGTAATAVTSSWTIDTTVPAGVVLTRTTPAASPTTTTTLSATISTTDASTTGYAFDWSLDCAGTGSDQSTTGVAYGTTITASSLPGGVCTLSVTLKDALGNAAAPATSSWTIDLTGPTLLVTGIPALTASTSVTGTVSSAASDWATYSYTLTGPSTANGTDIDKSSATISLSSLADGDYTLVTIGKDALGNVGASTITNFTINSQPPVITCPRNGLPVRVGDPIVVHFAQGVDDGSFGSTAPTVAGMLTAAPANGTLSADRKTLTLSPASGTWSSSAPVADRSISITAHSPVSPFTPTTTTCTFDIVPANEDEFYVSTTGAGTACTMGAPCLTLTQALSTSALGSGSVHTIYVSEGGYDEGAVIDMNAQTSVYGAFKSDWSARDTALYTTTFTRTTAAAGTATLPEATLVCSHAGFSVIDGLQIAAPSGWNGSGAGDQRASLVASTPCNAIFRNDTLVPALSHEGDVWTGLYVSASAGSANVTVESCTITDDTGDAHSQRTGIGGTLGASGQTGTVTGNAIHFTSLVSTVVGIGFDFGGSATGTMTIRANTIAVDDNGGTPVGVQISNATAVDATITGNTITMTNVTNGTGAALASGADFTNNTVTIAASQQAYGVTSPRNANGNTITLTDNASCVGISGVLAAANSNAITVAPCTTQGDGIDTTSNTFASAADNTITARDNGIFLNDSPGRTAALIVARNNVTMTGASAVAIKTVVVPSNAAVTVTLSDNIVQSATTAIYFWSGATNVAAGVYTITRNQATATAVGIETVVDGLCSVQNNFTSSGDTGVQLDGATNGCVMENNTIVAANVGIYSFSSAPPAIFDNIIANEATTGTTGIVASLGAVTARSIQNNDIYGFTDALDDLSAPQTYATADNVDAIDALNFNYNVSVDPLLTGFTPAATDCDISYGAQHETDVTDDITQAPRTAVPNVSCPSTFSTASGVSMGAVELP